MLPGCFLRDNIPPQSSDRPNWLLDGLHSHQIQSSRAPLGRSGTGDSRAIMTKISRNGSNALFGVRHEELKPNPVLTRRTSERAFNHN